MPSKFKKALGAVKDHTSIGLARVSRTATRSPVAHLDLLVLKATKHDENPVEERHIAEIFTLTKACPANASACVQSLTRRAERTCNWAVAVKCLHLVLWGMHGGGPHFSREVASAIHRGGRLLDLATFRGDSANGSYWDYTAFVRVFALYIARRLDSIVRGKIAVHRSASGAGPLCDMKPPEILDRITHWQALLDRVIATRPTGLARRSKLIHASFYLMVRESFELYKDISDGLTLILDGFFQLQRRTCTAAREACARAAMQFAELSIFYDACRAMKVGRKSEYPDVQKIPEKVLDTIRDFVLSGDNPSEGPWNAKPPMKMFAAVPSMAQFRKRSISPKDTEKDKHKLSDFVDFAVEIAEHKDPQYQCIGSGDLLLSMTEWPDKQEDSGLDVTEDNETGCGNGDDEWEVVFSQNRGVREKVIDVTFIEYKNPFLEEPEGSVEAATPTFCAGEATPSCEEDSTMDEAVKRELLERERQLWLEQQSKIIESRKLAP